MDKTLVASVAALALTSAGWVISQFYSLWRDDRSKRIQFTLEHAERQIAEFYAPMIALLEKLNETAQVKNEIVSQGLEEAKYLAFEKFIYYDYFLEQHRSIQKILSEKIHLLEGWQIPASYNEYLRHFTSENIYNNLHFKNDSDLKFQVHCFPGSFISDLKAGQNTVLKRYEASLAEQRDSLNWFLWSK